MVFGLFSGPRFSIQDVPDLSGKTAIVTGASSGLGEVSAQVLASKNAFVILACRSKAKADATVALIQKETPNAKLEVMELDLSDLASVKKFAEDYKKKGYDIDILLNNAGASHFILAQSHTFAGVMAPPTFQTTKNDLELQMGSNHLGHFYLTNLLLPVIEKTAKKGGEVKIVNVSSVAHLFAGKNGIDFDTFNNPANYSPYGNYGQSKLANILFTKSLQKNFDAKGLSNIYVNCLHPGVVSTNLQNNASLIPQWALPYLTYFGFSTPQHGTLTQSIFHEDLEIDAFSFYQLYCATSPEIVTKGYKAQYFVPTASLANPSAFGNNMELAEKLWKWSEDTLKEKELSRILACRFKAKADATVALIKKDVPNAKLGVMELYLSDLASVKQFAEDYENKEYDIDILMNNAGIFATPQYSETKQGIELQFGSNHLDVRIVNVSSQRHWLAAKNGIDFENLNIAEAYSPFGCYGQSKLANILFTRELQKLLDSKNITNIYVNSLHPAINASTTLKLIEY
ncbi:hypothetical protein HDU97_007955 [Phlyctochytrium planicorne]|nr:hypothetical protein HDU97_007955 [Phlyctochytrium planicorne]